MGVWLIVGLRFYLAAVLFVSLLLAASWYGQMRHATDRWPHTRARSRFVDCLLVALVCAVLLVASL